MVAFPPSPQRIRTLDALRAQIERLEAREARPRFVATALPPGPPARGEQERGKQGGGEQDCLGQDCLEQDCLEQGEGQVAGPPGAPGAGARPEGARVVSTGWPTVDGWLPGGVPRGLVTEWFGVAPEGPHANRAATAGGPRVPRPSSETPKAGRRPSLATWTPPLSLLVHLAHQVCGGARDVRGADDPGPVLWIGRRVWPYGRALVRAGPLGARLLARSLFVAMPDDVAPTRPSGTRTPEAGARLWALDLALRCRAVAAVVADGSGFAMAASRRLQVAAEAGHAFVLLARPAEEFDVPSAAAVRFVVTRTAIDADARPGAPRSCAWSLTLRRAKGAAARTRASVVSPAALSLAAPSLAALSSSSSLRGSSVRMAHGPEGPAVVLVWDAVHGVIERGAAPGLADGGARLDTGERGHAEPCVNAATDPGVVPTVVLDRPLATTTRTSGRGGIRADAAHSDAGRPEAGSPVEARRRRRTRARR